MRIYLAFPEIFGRPRIEFSPNLTKRRKDATFGAVGDRRVTRLTPMNASSNAEIENVRHKSTVMLNKEQTRFSLRFRRIPSSGVRRPVMLRFAAVTVAAIVAAALGATTSSVMAQATSPNRVNPVASSAHGDPLPVAPNDRLNSRSLNAFSVGETTENARCVQRTFRVPENQNAALIATFLLRLLPENLREQTTCRYSEEENLVYMYGPEMAIDFSENLLNNFSETLFEAFLTSGEFVSVAGVSRQRNIPAVEQKESSSVGQVYYDPSRNENVRVAYEAQGAVIPDRREYAVAFGAGDQRDATQTNAVGNEYNRPTFESVQRRNSELRNKSNPLNDDDIADVASYRCSPTACDRVAQLVQRRFASNPEVAFSVDSQLGTIVVHANRKNQREVREFLAQLQVYPSQTSAYGADMRVARGDIVPIDGYSSEETPVARSLNQVSPLTNPQSTRSNDFESSLSDVYMPQNRKAEELKDSMLQLFGERLARLPSDATAPFSQRQIATYRFVGRVQTNEEGQTVQARVCDVSIDALHNKIMIQGDSRISSQMIALLRAMDQPPLRNGNLRRFIPIKNCDPNKLQQIFEYDAKKNADRGVSRVNSMTPCRVADELRRRNLPEIRDLASAAPVLERFNSVLNDLGANKICNFETIAFQSSDDDSLYDVYAAVDAIGSTTTCKNAIRQVAYQEGDFGDLNSIGNDLDSFRDGRGGIGVVQDVAPTVLPDIDVVIIENATDAEFERIKQMINQIEELSKIAEIQTEIYNLKYVDCAMLHGVLTTLYEEMFTAKQGRVVFYALQNPNALLVAGWGRAFEDMKTLIQLFDNPVADGAGTYRVVRLKYASVDEIADLLTSTFITPQTTGTGGFAPRIRVFADVRTNSLVIQASPNDWNEIKKILLELDVNKAETKLVTRVFPLKNSLAENIRTTIMNAILPAKQGTLDTTAAKFPVLQLLSVDETGRRLVESGVMMDVDVSADVFHNQLVVSAPEDCMEFMERLIELLDVAPRKAQIRFFQVQHGDASQIIQTLQSLLATTDNNLSAPTLPQAEAEESFVPVRFALDTRTNVIIAAAAPKELAIIDALIVALDVKDTSEREEVVVQLRNIQAPVVAEAIDSYLTQKLTLETSSEVLSTYQVYESQVIVIPESISNSIIVSASPDKMRKILEMIRTFDQDPPQVQIKVLIAEVTLANQEEFGIESGLQNSASFDRSLITTTASGSTVGNPGFDIIGGNGPGKNMSSSVSPTDVAGQVLNNFAMGTADSTLGYGGFVLSASSRSIAATLRALREKNRLQVLSCPQVTAMDNQQAFILVGQRVPRINGTTTTNYGVQMNTTDTPVGLILLVTPRVTKDGKVVMEIGAEKSSLGNDSDATPIYSQDGEVIKSRSIDTIQTMTAISARDGETVMLGGLLTSEKEKISRGVPYVSDIPILGWLFRYDQEVMQRKELLIVMTPRIMRNSDDFAEVMQREMGRMHVNLDEAMSINGNMGLYDPCTDQGYQPKERRLIQDLVHPDKMDEFENLPPYSPDRDYKPRPIIETTSDPYQTDAAYPASNNLGSPQRIANPQNSVVNRRFTSLQNAPSPEPRTSRTSASSSDEPVINDEFLIDDRFTSGSTSRTDQTKERKVAMRDTNTTTGASQPQRDPARQRLETVDPNRAELDSSQRAGNLRGASATTKRSQEGTTKKALGISMYRKDQKKAAEPNDDVARSSELEEAAEAYGFGSGTIRGQIQDVETTYRRNLDSGAKLSPNLELLSRLATTVPYNEASETSKFKLFHWSKN